MGDAAHAMEPNFGQGACQAIEDALALGIAAHDAAPCAVLPAFEALRLGCVRTFVRRSAEARRAIHGPGPVQAAMQLGLHLMPAFVGERTIGGLQRLPDYGQGT